MMLTKSDQKYTLAYARDKLNLTQGELGEKIGTDQGTISKIESGNLLGEYFVKYLKFLASKKNINVRAVIHSHEIVD